MQKKISNFMLLSFFVLASLNLLFYLLVGYINELLLPELGARFLIYVFFSCLFAIIVTITLSVLSPLWFDSIMTLRRMLRTESLSNPLLVRLSSDAPGTYHHSINVSTLAQKAAKAIGADTLLIRTAAYYHDIGKLITPETYVENQSGVQIPTTEDENSIRQNAEKIISHVEKGVQIAIENKLPEDIIDLIREHHGNTKALYFYQKAKEQGLKVKKTDFRYPGPVPHSKESVILMLADCVEAIAKALPEVTTEKINGVVDNTIKERREEKQLKAANLSEKEIELIGNSLKETLNAIYHQRIIYKNGQFNN